MKRTPQTVSPRAFASLPAWILSCFLASETATAAELSAAEKAALAGVEAALKHLETNLALAEQAAGPGTERPPASKARLALTRLGAAMSAAPGIEASLKTLPAENEEVKAARGRYDAAAKRAASLEARLAGKASGGDASGAAATAKPAPGAPAMKEGSSPATTVKLDYRQEEALKNARFHVRDAEGKASALVDLQAKVAAERDVTTLDHRLLATAMRTLADARGRLEDAEAHLRPLPPEGAGVGETARALKDVGATLDGAEKALAPVHAKLVKLVDPASYPDLAADLVRLGDLARMFASPEVLQANRAAAAEIVRQSPAALEEAKRILAVYAPLVRQGTEEGRRFEGVGKFFAESHAAFWQAAGRQKEALPGEIRAESEAVVQLADQAVREEKPAFFGGGIPQRVGFVEDRLHLYAALEPEGAKPLEADLKRLREDLKRRAGALKDSIIAANEPPPDRYQGADRKDLERLAAEAWKTVQPDAKILAVRIPSQDWARESLWRYQASTWNKVDGSRLQVQLLVQHDARLAVTRPVDLWKDHLKGDRISASPLDGKADELPPQRFLAAAKVR